jgi:uncharacterized membrane protein (UPF0127 family)
MEKLKNDKVMRMSIAVLVGLVIVFAGALIFAGRNASEETQVFLNEQEESLKKAVVNIGGNHLIASIANTPLSRKKGLSNVHSIGPNEGKLFVFDKEDYHEFWMKDMNFNIDIIFINSQGTVVDIIENVSPDTYPKTFRPKYPAIKVVEVNAGWAAQNNVKVGEMMIWTELK